MPSRLITLGANLILGGASPLGLRNNSPFGQFPLSKRDAASRTSFARAIIYHYDKQYFGNPSNIRAPFSLSVLDSVSKVVLESEIDSVSIRKSISQPSATFEMNLFPTENFKRKVSPGDWIILYLFSGQEPVQFLKTEEISPLFLKNAVLLGNVDRVARVIEKDEETDKTTIRYRVSGRNFGKVFEDTDVWFDPYQTANLDQIIRNAGLEIVGPPDLQVKSILNCFLGLGLVGPGGATTPLNQWSIPTQLGLAFKRPPKRGLYYFEDILEGASPISRTIEPGLPGAKPSNYITVDSNGSLWDMLQRSCNGLINELFLEEVRQFDGTIMPSVVMRPRPFNSVFFDPTGQLPQHSQWGAEAGLFLSGIRGKYATMQDLARTSYVEISRGEVLYENLGKDDHSRVNMILLRHKQGIDYVRSYMSGMNIPKGIGNPLFSRESIQRYGLKRFDQLMEWVYPLAPTSLPDIQQMKAFMVQLYDMHFANHLWESGTIETTGVLEAELGKSLNVLPDMTSGPVPVPPKIYYIEGYEHNWKFPNTWRTTFTVTRGQYLPLVPVGPMALNVFIDQAPGNPLRGLNLFPDFGFGSTDDDHAVAQTVTRKD